MMVMNVIYILLGWLLGLLSQPIGERINRHYQKTDVRLGIISELKEMKVRLVSYVYVLSEKIGPFDKELIEWTKENLAGYEGNQPAKRILSCLEEISKRSDNPVECLQLLRSPQAGGFSLKRLYLPFLESKMGFLPLFSNKFQGLIHNIRSKNQIMNEDVESGIFYHRLTFDSSLSPENREIVLKNINSCY